MKNNPINLTKSLLKVQCLVLLHAEDLRELQNRIVQLEGILSTKQGDDEFLREQASCSLRTP